MIVVGIIGKFSSLVCALNGISFLLYVEKGYNNIVSFQRFIFSSYNHRINEKQMKY